MTEDQERQVRDRREQMHRRGVPGDELTDEQLLILVESDERLDRGQSTWRDWSRNVILETLADGQAQGLSGAALVAAVDAAYPFGLRANHPYQQWLSERRRILEAEGLLTPRPRPDESFPLFAHLEE